MKKIVGISVLVLIMLGTLAYYVPYTQHISVELEGFECRIGEELCDEDIVVSLEGTYQNYLIKTDHFVGKFNINKYDFPKYSENIEFYVNDGLGMMFSSSFVNGQANNETFGYILFSSKFKEILITVWEPIGADSQSWSGTDGLYIVAPAKNHAEALQLAWKLSQNSHWLSVTEWE